ncbi:YjjG family noncanonical pyrimidine nucleotidase [Anaerocolumna aminovalerica]|uniref:YjjG family noncanonical pyrimidine nucleotidase n=1 Tax=Anaerocolumna aminovalerica TaxID=1527 RepID=UPI001C0F144A|nr:YjjG family noncanonical pyrimidine nucleotidase [Anaerocolumna aminovalerica]MBU5334455.1 YjjG family noncanonical pyrimidine nucleotidase [Anaerocolumna aminovalerica]
MYRIFLLDIDNTLLDFDAAEKRGFKKVIESYEIEYNNEMLEQYKRINRNLWNLLEQGKIEKEELLNTRFGEFFRLYHIEASGIEAESRFRKHLGESSDLVLNAKETLLELKKQEKKLYSASNGVYDTQIQRLKNAGIYDLFDGMFISEKVGYEKPALPFFEYCFNNIQGFEKEKTIMVGDSISSDIQGAVNAGIDSCLFSRSENPVLSSATYTIRDISELLHI